MENKHNDIITLIFILGWSYVIALSDKLYSSPIMNALLIMAGLAAIVTYWLNVMGREKYELSI